MFFGNCTTTSAVTDIIMRRAVKRVKIDTF